MNTRIEFIRVFFYPLSSSPTKQFLSRIAPVYRIEINGRLNNSRYKSPLYNIFIGHITASLLLKVKKQGKLI